MSRPAQVGDVVEYVDGDYWHLKQNLGAIGIVADTTLTTIRVNWIFQPKGVTTKGVWRRQNFKVLIEAKDVVK